MALTKVSGDFIKAGSVTQAHLHSSHGITTSHLTEGDKLFFTNARVDSRIGSLSSSDLSEGTNLYYTDARARAAISGTGSLSYNSTTGVMSFTMPAQNTSNITEGSNLYYTDARADARIAAADTGDLSEGTNLYYTDARADARITAASTSDLSEGTNLYYTDARADARVALIVDSAPGTLNTLNELAAALGDDANFSTTVTNSIALKAPLASPSFTGNATFAGGITVSSPGSSFYTTFKSANDYVIGLKDSANATQWWLKAYTNGGFALHEDNVGDKFTIAAGGNATFAGTIAASGYNDSNWNTAYGWGNHASAGYLASSSYTAADVLSKILTVDGAGSGLDADLLDGVTSSGYHNVTSNPGTAGHGTISIGNNGSYSYVQSHAGQPLRLNPVGNQLQAASIYDYNDTTYYINPASESKIFKLWINNGGASGVGWSTGFNMGDASNYWNMIQDGGIARQRNFGTGGYDWYSSGGSQLMDLSNTGVLFAAADMRAPIFYDSADTNSYFDSGTLVLRSGDPTVYLRDTNHRSVALHNNSNRFYVLGAPVDSTSYAQINGVWPWYVQLDTNDVYTGSVGYAGASYRAPIFYDSADTTYYLDPASTSQVNTMEFVGSTNNGRFFGDTWGVKLQTDAGYILFGPANTGHAHIYTDRSNFYFNQQIQLNGGSLINTNDIRAGIFYDVNDTGYYVDPASKSFLSTIHFNGSVSGTSAGSEIGRNHAYDTMELKGYGAEFMIGAQNAEININYRTCNGGVSGHTPTTWKWRAGSSSNWSDHYMGLIQSSSSMRAPIFYDSNNTTYYTDPGSTSSIVSIAVKGEISLPASNLSTLGAGSRPAYSIYQEGGSWSSPFPDLCIAMHTGIKFGAHASYNGMRFYDDYTMATQVMSINNSADPLGANNVYVTNNLQAGSSLRAPIFYDSNDTGFYCDPNSTSYLSKIWTRGATTGNAAPRWDTSFHVAQSQHFYGHTSTQTLYFGESNPAIFGSTLTVAGVIDANGGHGGINITNTSILSDNTSTWTGNPGGAGKIQYHSNRWYIVSDSSSNRIVQFRRDGSDVSYIDNSGRLMNAPDLRVPIYYDTNTNYYGDFGGNTHLNTMSCAGGLLFGDNYGVGVTGLYSASRIQTIFNMGGSYKLPNDGNSTGSAYGLYWSHQNAGSTGGANNLASHGIIILENGTYKGSWGGGRLVTPSDVRAPIFYDYNNTSYYVNPDSTSSIVNLTVANTISGSITRTAGTSGYGHPGTGMWPFYNWGGSNGGASAPTGSSYTTGISIGSHPGDQAYGWQMANNMWNAGIWYRTYNSGFSSWYKLLDNTTNTQTINSSLYVNNDVGIGFTSGSIGGKLNIKRTTAGISIKNDLGGSLSGSTIGLHQYTSASMNSGGYHMVFQAAPTSGSDTNMLLCNINGNLRNRNNSYGQYSDRNIKENIVDATSKLEDVKKLRIRNFNFIGDDLKQIGLIAQETELVFPGLVENDLNPQGDEVKSLKYSVLVPILVKAMQEQQAIIDDLKSRLETLENQ